MSNIKNSKQRLQSLLSQVSLATPSNLDDLAFPSESAMPLSSIETDLMLNFATRRYLHTPEQIAQELRIDEEGKIWWKRQGVKNNRRMNKPVGSLGTHGYLELMVNNMEHHTAHTIAFVLYHNRFPNPGKVIDHINGNKLDNRKENLREVSNAENMRNRKGLHPHNKSGTTGVYWLPNLSKWVVKLRFNGKNIHGGYYTNLDDAIAARYALEIKYDVVKHSLLTRQLNSTFNKSHKTETFEGLKL